MTVRKGMTVFFLMAILMDSFLIGGCKNEAVYEIEMPQETPQEKESENETDDTAELEKEKEQTVIYVHVCGAVQNPGVYTLCAKSRVAEALAAAGGLRADASADSLNQARILTDGEQIRVLTTEEFQSGVTVADNPVGDTALSDTAGLIDLNTADAQTLMTLNGIGETKAQAIIDYRKEQGAFQSIEELLQVSGIGEGTFEKIRDRITINH